MGLNGGSVATDSGSCIQDIFKDNTGSSTAHLRAAKTGRKNKSMSIIDCRRTGRFRGRTDKSRGSTDW
jgi:hypothetical protein